MKGTKIKKPQKKQFVVSIFCLLMCLAMFIGSTFAWFTDTASTSVNKIESGTLDVDIVNTNGGTLDGGTLNFLQTTDDKGTQTENPSVLWEPGVTFNTTKFKIVNKGSLALKYKISITGANGDTELLDVIKFYVVDGNNSTELGNYEGKLSKKDDTSGELYIKAQMDKSAGNDYQGKKLTGITISVVATQDNVEYDSEGNSYDAKAEYPVVTVSNVAISESKTTVETTINSNDKVDGTNTYKATVVVPSGAKVSSNGETAQLKLVVNESSIPSNFTYYDSNTQTASTLEVDMEGLDDANEAKLKISIYVGSGLNDFKLYHKNELMNKKDDLANLSDDQDYYYNIQSGVVTMLTTKFSPFTYVYKTDRAYDETAKNVVYPTNVTKDTFTENNNVAYVDAEGTVKYVADINDAINAGATTIYLKEDSTISNSRTPDLKKNTTIYANGSNFQYKEISLNGTNLGIDHTSDGVDLTVYDAKNIRIWGFVPSQNSTNNVVLINCTYNGAGVGQSQKADGIFFISENTSYTPGTINLFMNNCKVSGSNQGVYTNANGTLTIKNCSFVNCATGIKAAHKTTSGTLTINVQNTTFDQCGCNTEYSDMKWLIEDSSAIKCKTKSTNGGIALNLTNVSVTNTIGNYSFHIDDDEHENKYVGTTTVTANNVTVDGTAWTYPASED